jgi:CRP/FNR family transcriptional regulator
MKVSYGACVIEGTEFFGRLPKETLKNVADKIKDKSLVHELSRQEDGAREFPVEGKVYIIHEGRVFLSHMDESGKKIILSICSPGDVFGDLDFNDRRPSFSDSFFIEPYPAAKVCQMDKETFGEILRESPELSLSLISSLSRRLVDASEKVGAVAFADVEKRLLAQLLHLGQTHGHEEGTTVKIDLRLTHEKLGEMIGAARETVSEAISDLRRRGVLSVDADKHFVLDKKNRKTGTGSELPIPATKTAISHGVLPQTSTLIE